MFQICFFFFACSKCVSPHHQAPSRSFSEGLSLSFKIWNCRYIVKNKNQGRDLLGKLAQERNSKTVPMGMEMSVGDLLTTHKLKNTDATSHLHIDQRNIRSAAKIRWQCSSGVGDILTTQAQKFKTCFFCALNNGVNLTSANVSKSRCVICFNTLLPLIWRATPTNAY